MYYARIIVEIAEQAGVDFHIREICEAHVDTMDTMDTLFLLGDPCPLGEPRMNESTLVKKRDFHGTQIHLKRPCHQKIHGASAYA